MQGWREEEIGLKEQQRETERWSLKKGGGVKYEQKEILGVSDVICSSCTKARISHMFHQSNRLYQAEQTGAGQGSSLACIYSTETFLRVNGWQRVGQETDIIQSDSIKERITSGRTS